MPSSQIETNAILSKMKRKQVKIERSQTALYTILNYKKEGIKAQLKRVQLDNKQIKIEFKTVDSKRMEQYLKKVFKRVEQFKKRDSIEFKVML